MARIRRENPGCLIALWGSLECTNHSKAKGGLSRDGDSRSLADHLYRYIEAFNPDFVWIENVTEFLEWGPIRIREGKGSTDLYCELDIDKKKGEYVFIPDKRYLKEYYEMWIFFMKQYGYEYDYKALNAADYGAFQSRNRYFGQFAKAGLPIVFPVQTHAKDPKKSKIKDLKKWRAVKKVLRLEDEGNSIFERKKPLAENTLKRIFAGLIKFVANGDKEFIQKNFSGNPNGKVSSLDSPAGSITTVDHHSVVKCVPGDNVFISRYNGDSPEEKVKDIESPIGAISTSNRHSLVKYVFLSAYYGNGTSTSVEDPCNTVTTNDRFAAVSAKFLLDYQFQSGAHNLEDPCPTVTTKDKFSPVTTHFITSNFKSGGQSNSIENPSPCLTTVPKHNLTEVKYMMDNQYGQSSPTSVDSPSGTVTVNPKQSLVEIRPWLINTAYSNVGSDLEDPCPTLTASRRHHYLINPSWGITGIRSIDDPSFTIIARMDKAPPYLVSSEAGSYGVIVYEDDCETMVKIKWFMAMYGIADIKMRMLNIPELLSIQGFPKKYKLIGTQTEQKKYIGNAVEVTVGKSLFRCLDSSIQDTWKEELLVS